MPSVAKKIKQKSAKNPPPAATPSKFVSESLQKKSKSKHIKKKTPKHKKRGVVYIKHLPHGFYEDQLRGFFSQFGEITRLRLARSTKTLNSKGFAFIEFRFPEVAEIAAEALNNYIMFKNIIKTRFIRPNEIKHDFFRSSVKKVMKDGEKVLTSKTIQAREAVVQKNNRLMTDDDEKKRNKIIAKRLNKAKKNLAALGIDYNIDAVSQNMGDEVMAAARENAENSPKKTAPPAESSDDEWLNDPEALDDLEPHSEESGDSEDDDDEEKLKEAVRLAEEARKKQIQEQKAEKQKKGKENKIEKPVAEKPAKKAAAKKNAKKPEPEATEPEIEAPPARKGRAVKKTAEKVTKVEKAKPAVAETKKQKVAAKKAPAPVAAEPVKPKKAEKSKKAPKAVPAANPEPSPPAKVKKLAKTSKVIEKKKPQKDDSKLKKAAKAVDTDKSVKVVKNKDIADKKKTRSKK